MSASRLLAKSIRNSLSTSESFALGASGAFAIRAITLPAPIGMLITATVTGRFFTKSVTDAPNCVKYRSGPVIRSISRSSAGSNPASLSYNPNRPCPRLLFNSSIVSDSNEFNLILRRSSSQARSPSPAPPFNIFSTMRRTVGDRAPARAIIDRKTRSMGPPDNSDRYSILVAATAFNAASGRLAISGVTCSLPSGAIPTSGVRRSA